MLFCVVFYSLLWFYVGTWCISGILLVAVFVWENEVKRKKREWNRHSTLSWRVHCQHDARHDMTTWRLSPQKDKSWRNYAPVGWQVDRHLDDTRHPPDSWQTRRQHHDARHGVKTQIFTPPLKDSASLVSTTFSIISYTIYDTPVRIIHYK